MGALSFNADDGVFFLLLCQSPKVSRLTKVLSEALSSPVLSEVWTRSICAAANAGGFVAAPPGAAIMASLEVSDVRSLEVEVSPSGAKDTDVLSSTMAIGFVVGSSASRRGCSHSFARSSCSLVARSVECSSRAGQFGGAVSVEGK